MAQFFEGEVNWYGLLEVFKKSPVSASTADSNAFSTIMESIHVSLLCIGTVLDGSGGLFGLAPCFQNRHILQHVFALAVHKGMMCQNRVVVPCPWSCSK